VRAVYLGHEVLTFNDYLDLETGRTLAAEPGGVYDVAPAGGLRPDVPPGWFAPAIEEKQKEPAEATDGESEPEE